MNVVIYARVSSMTQDLELQIKEIQKFCDYRNFNVVRIITDKRSGKDMARPGFKEMIDLLDTNELGIHAIVIHKLDRIGRSLSDLIKLAEWLKVKNIQLISVTDNIDTSTTSGYLAFQVMGAMAEYERHVINERTEFGRKEAMDSGIIKFGRPRKDIPIDQVQKDLLMGLSKAFICRKYDIKRSTLYKKLEEDKKKTTYLNITPYNPVIPE